MNLRPLKATILDEDRVALLAIPYGGPIPSPISPRGVDLDGEFFSERTDLKPEWFDVRLVDWHHGADPVMRRTVIGKAENLRQSDEGWWVDVWFDHGQRRLDLVKRLAERGAQLFGSSESVPGLVAKAETGELLTWPYVRQTLSTSPQNTYSVMRPLKATLDDYIAAGVMPTDRFWSDVASAMRNLGDDLRATFPGDGRGGEDVAKAGRVLRQSNYADIQAAFDRLAEALRLMQQVLERQPDYGAQGAPAPKEKS